MKYWHCQKCGSGKEFFTDALEDNYISWSDVCRDCGGVIVGGWVVLKGEILIVDEVAI